jgi:putative salt-induced outer membrane protein
LRSESDDTTIAEQYNASEKFTWDLIDKNYTYERFAWDRDRFAGVQNRYDSSAGLGRTILDLTNDKLIGELGAGYINEERTEPPRNDFGSGRAYAKYIRTISKTANFSQDIEYLASFKDADAYRLNTETAIIASISTHLSLKASYIWKRINKPAPGFSKDDTITSVALIINY